MYGFVLGDIAGSQYEFAGNRDPNVPLFDKKSFFTDDTVMGVAVAESIRVWKNLLTSQMKDYRNCGASMWVKLQDTIRRNLKMYALDYPDCSYGNSFRRWMESVDSQPYNSCGNGSAMRASACGEMASTEQEAQILGYYSSVVTHNHPEGIKGAVCVAHLVYWAKRQADKDFLIKEAKKFYDFDLNVKHLRESYNYTELCQLTMPAALTCLFGADSFEEVLRNCVSIGGDADTIAAIAGSVAEYLYGIPWHMFKLVGNYLDSNLMADLAECHVFAERVGTR